jgi:hypothetical protein
MRLVHPGAPVGNRWLLAVALCQTIPLHFLF